MKKILLYIFILILATNCKSTTDNIIDSKNIESKDTITTELKIKKIEKPKIEKSPHIEDSISEKIVLKDSTIHNLFNVAKNPNYTQESLKLNFKTISKQEFSNFKKSFNFKISKDKIIQEDSTKFILKSSKSVYELHEGGHLSIYPKSDYYGYLEPLNSYIIGSGGDGIYKMFLLDKSTDVVISLPSFLDYSGNLPRISPDNSKLISHEVDFDQSNIILSKMMNNRISSSKVYESRKWSIDDILWIDNNNIALKVCDKIEYVSNGENNCIGTKYLIASIE